MPQGSGYGKKKKTTKKKVPPGYHLMPSGKLMKGSKHPTGKKKKK